MGRVIELEVQPPFHLEATVRLLQRRPVDLVDRFTEEGYWRLWSTEEGPILSRVWNQGSVHAPALRLDFPARRPSPGLAEELERRLRLVLGLDVDTAAFLDRALRLAPLARVVEPLRGMRPPRFPSLFEAIARTVPFQQLSLDAGVALLSRLVERCGEALSFEGQTFHAFPLPEALNALSVEDFRGMGYSRAKGRCLIEAARRVRDGALRDEAVEALPSRQAFDSLLALPGIGPWSASLILLRGLGRLDSFPSGDVGVRRGLARILDEDPLTFDSEGYASAFGEQKGMLYFCSLGAQLLARGLVRPAPSLSL